MKAINFPGANTKYAENQPEYQTLPAYVAVHSEISKEVTMCFELSDEEKKQVSETGCIWLSILQPKKNQFHPINPDLLKPDFK